MLSLGELFELFVRERRYAKAVSKRTLDWYANGYSAFAPLMAKSPGEITKADVIDQMEAMRARGVQPVSVRTYSKLISTFFRWLVEEGHADQMPRVPAVIVPKKIQPAYSIDYVRKIANHRSQNPVVERVRAICLVIFDTGLRIDEVFSLRRSNVFLDQMLIKVDGGKGGKDRVVPMSAEGRKVIYLWMKHNKPNTGDLVFYAGNGSKLNYNNVLRDKHKLMREIHMLPGKSMAFHSMRRTFAREYVRRGGSLFALQEILGHSTLEMTRRYVALDVDDLRKDFNRLSALSVR